MVPVWQNSPERSHIEITEELLDPLGARIIDVGCGAGQITRALAKMGAEVIGIDPSTRQLKRARSEPPLGNEIYIKGTAENLPFDDQSVDIILFFNSFHHVPKNEYPRALQETYRVLRPGGQLLFAEPIADGPQFELSKLINDETDIRALAYEYILTVPSKGFKEITELIYITENQHKDFESFKTNSISINPTRSEIFEKQDKALRKKFNELSKKKQGFYTFLNPIRGNLFSRI